MRADIQEIFKMTPHEKQVLMFSATLNNEMRTVCKKFMTNVRCHTCQRQRRQRTAPWGSRRLAAERLCGGAACVAGRAPRLPQCGVVSVPA